jgi:hypothetical protein
MDTAEATKILNKALIAEGFVDGKYGEVPYDIVMGSLTNGESDYSIVFKVIADGRSMGRVYFDASGDAIVRLDIANWLNPKESTFWTKMKPVFMGQIPIRTDVKVPLDTLVVERHVWLPAKIEHIKIDLKLELE